MMGHDRPRRSVVRTHKTLLASAGCLALLTGCGSVSPTTAASVGETAISMSRVNEVSTDYCAATAPAYEQNGVMLPMGTIRRQVVSSLVLRTIADQMAAEYDVSPGARYAQAVQQAKAQTQALPEDQRDAAVTVDSTGGYLQDIALAAAQADLKAEGVSGLDDDQVTEKAIDLFANWGDRSPVDLNPKFGVEFDRGQFVPLDDGDLSIGVSDNAQSAEIIQRFEGAADQQEQIELSKQLTGYARTLPESQRCG